MAYVTGYGAIYPVYVPRTISNTIAGASLGTPQKFTMAKGYVVLSFTDSFTGYVFSFALTGGYNPPYLLPTANSALFAIPATAIGCTVTPLAYNPGVSTTVQVVTPIGDSGGRTYLLTFFVTPGILPTIQLTGGAAPTQNLVATSTDHVNMFP
jgi:hypothetical protein